MGEATAATKEVKEVKKVEGEKEVKKVDGEKKAEKKKEPKEVKKVNVKSTKANPNAAIDPRTGTRFAPQTARQLAFDIVIDGVRKNKNVKEIREVLGKTKKESGADFSLDIGYLNFVCAFHPDFFDVFSDGSIKLVKEPKIDHELAKKFEEEKNAKKVKAEKARADRKKPKEEGEKAEKVEKSDKPVEKKHKHEDKPSKKEKEG